MWCWRRQVVVSCGKKNEAKYTRGVVLVEFVCLFACLNFICGAVHFKNTYPSEKSWPLLHQQHCALSGVGAAIVAFQWLPVD